MFLYLKRVTLKTVFKKSYSKIENDVEKCKKKRLESLDEHLFSLSLSLSLSGWRGIAWSKISGQSDCWWWNLHSNDAILSPKSTLIAFVKRSEFNKFDAFWLIKMDESYSVKNNFVGLHRMMLFKQELVTDHWDI